MTILTQFSPQGTLGPGCARGFKCTRRVKLCNDTLNYFKSIIVEPYMYTKQGCWCNEVGI